MGGATHGTNPSQGLEKRNDLTPSRRRIDERYPELVRELSTLLDAARRAAARAVNTVMTATYWEVGRRIVEHEQAGSPRAEYGKSLISRLSADLTKRFGRGFGPVNLSQMKRFYLTWGPGAILQTSSEESRSQPGTSARFPLPWSHYVRLLSVENPLARRFYEAEALRGGWTVRQLARQIGSQFYERAALSRNKAKMLATGAEPRPEDVVDANEEIRSPLVLEFLGLKDEYSESELEEALIRHLETFLLELGGDFAFVGRQRRLRLDDAWYRMDLVFFHRALRCLVIVDLKLDPLTPGDVGQMHVYCNYARVQWTRPGENPPVGIILCAQEGAELARYALEGLPSEMLVREYLTVLPEERVLAEELARTRRLLEERRA